MAQSTTSSGPQQRRYVRACIVIKSVGDVLITAFLCVLWFNTPFATAAVLTLQVIAACYDNPIPGYGTNTVGNLRLWEAKPVNEFDLEEFNEGHYVEVGSHNMYNYPVGISAWYTATALY